MSIEDEARAQADRAADDVFEEWNPFSNTVDAWTDGFTEGAVWASQREPTDAEAKAAFLAFMGVDEGEFDGRASTHRAACIGQARAALMAALSARNTRETET